MCQGIPLNDILEDDKNWSPYANRDIMTQNFFMLKPVMNKMYFYRYPEHPKLFSLLFSNPSFADDLINVILNADVTDLDRIYFEEYSEEDREVLISKGFTKLRNHKENEVSVIYLCHNNTIFVNLVL